MPSIGGSQGGSPSGSSSGGYGGGGEFGAFGSGFNGLGLGDFSGNPFGGNTAMGLAGKATNVFAKSVIALGPAGFIDAAIRLAGVKGGIMSLGVGDPNSGPSGVSGPLGGPGVGGFGGQNYQVSSNQLGNQEFNSGTTHITGESNYDRMPFVYGENTGQDRIDFQARDAFEALVKSNLDSIARKNAFPDPFQINPMQAQRDIGGGWGSGQGPGGWGGNQGGGGGYQQPRMNQFSMYGSGQPANRGYNPFSMYGGK